MRIALRGSADRWTEALPLGNGRIGAMVHGDMAASRFQINEDSCWTGSPATSPGNRRDDRPRRGPEAIAEIRDALARGDHAAATRVEHGLQRGYSQAYQPLADLVLETSGSGSEVATRRELDLAEAHTLTRWETPTGTVQEQALVSAPDQVLHLERSADGAPLDDIRVRLESPHPTGSSAVSAGALTLTVRLPSDIVRGPGKREHLEYDDGAGRAVQALLTVLLDHDGTATPDEDNGTVLVHGATRLRLVLAAATDSRGAAEVPHGDVTRLRAEATAAAGSALDLPPAELRERHVAAHRELWDRTRIELVEDSPAAVELPALQHLTAETGDTRLLAQLAAAYGRYLMISSSRPGTLPATLQGICNEKLLPPWHCDFTTNINLEMNYWPAEITGLPECREPLLTWLSELARSGERTARDLYGLPGWTAHHNSDRWAFSAPVGDGAFDPVWSMWPLAGAWLCRHVREAWEFSGDDEILRRMWPVLEGAARFLDAWLVEVGPGVLGTSPSTSPENRFRLPDGTVTGLTTSTTADLAMIRDHFRTTLDAAEVLGIEDPLLPRLRSALERIPTERVDPEGRISEWETDREDEDPHHRHQTHLYSVLPGDAITPEQPELADAARRSLEGRGAESTGWSLAWRVGLRARLGDGREAHHALRNFLAPIEDPDAPGPHGRAGLYANLFCAHPPFQIDGNFGITSAVYEMVVQSHGGLVRLLPALPAEWPEGRVLGVRLRGGLTLDLRWSRGEATELTMSGPAGREVTLSYGARSTRVRIGQEGVFAGDVSEIFAG